MNRPVLDLRTHEGNPIATYEARMDLLERALAEIVDDSAHAKRMFEVNHARLVAILDSVKETEQPPDE